MWVTTSRGGPDLGLHLGMAGRIFVTDADGTVVEGGDPAARGVVGQGRVGPLHHHVRERRGAAAVRQASARRGRGSTPTSTRSAPTPRRSALAEFRDRLARGTAPVKARLLDQSVLAGVGNLLADQTLWQARLDPRRRVDTLSADEVGGLHRALRSATKSAIRKGGVHTGEVIAHRNRGGQCPRCGAEMTRATVGGRTTWWCPAEQV